MSSRGSRASGAGMCPTTRLARARRSCVCRRPAPSRREMRCALARFLAVGRRVVRVDRPGFGDDPAICYRAALYTRFLAAFVERFAAPVDVVAAGHAAGYALEVARSAPGRFRHLALLAPTWRGPLPTAMGPHARCWSALEELVRAPLVGPLLYALNSSRGLIRWMMRRHVYAEPAHITDSRLDARVRTAHQPTRASPPPPSSQVGWMHFTRGTASWKPLAPARLRCSSRSAPAPRPSRWPR